MFCDEAFEPCFVTAVCSVMSFLVICWPRISWLVFLAVVLGTFYFAKDVLDSGVILSEPLGACALGIFYFAEVVLASGLILTEALGVCALGTF